MFRQIIAIDIAERIPNFQARLAEISAQPPIVLAHAKELALSGCQRETVDGLLVSIYEDISEEFIHQLPSLSYIGVLGTSVKKIPMQLCEKRGIVVRNVTDYCDEETAEWVMLQIMKFFRDRMDPVSVRDKSLGVIGVGAVGMQVIKLARALHMNVFYNATKANHELDQQGVRWLSKEAMFASCDVISCHTPPFLAWLTAHMLAHAKPNLCLVTTCMGKISKDSDLENFLQARSDVTLVMDSVAAKSYETLKQLAPMCNHAAYLTRDVKERLVRIFFAHVEQFLANTRRSPVH